MASLIKEFSLERIQKAGAIFDIKRLDFLNGFYLRERSVPKVTEFCLPYFISAGLITQDFVTEQFPPAYGASEIKEIYKVTQTGERIKLETLQKIVALYKERLKKISEIVDMADFFFKDKLDYDKDLLKWKESNDEEIKNSFILLEKIFDKIKKEDWTKENLEKEIMPQAEKIGDRGKMLWPLRAALTGKKASAGPFEVAEILGKEKCQKRIKEAENLYKK
jgi:glutamyl/glutaminyl-tRNA synthetase